MIETEGIKYAGSKLKLIPGILELINDLPEIKTVLDGFSGTTRVSQAFAKSGFRIIANDISVWSLEFGTAYLTNTKSKKSYEELIRYLNSISGRDGWFTEHYGGFDCAGSSVQADGTKRLWQIHNTRKLDGIRDEIDRLCLSRLDRAVVLSSLMLALDKVDNTIGHFCSYLKCWSARSYKIMELKVPDLFENIMANIVRQNNIFDVINDASIDFAYFDPPYGSNNQKMPSSRVRYAPYYHIWTTICKNDKPELFGAANRRKDTSDTQSTNEFEDFRTGIAAEAIDRLVKNTKARYIALSYGSCGKVTIEELHDILTAHGKIIKVVKIDHKKNAMAYMKWSNEFIANTNENYEFIFLIKK